MVKKSLAKVFGVLLAVQLVCPVQVFAQAANLDLGSTDRNMQASQQGNFTSAQIQTADGARTVSPTDNLTAAESIALLQVLSGGSQSLLLGASGNAIGGSFQIPTSMSQSLNNLVIPQGVTALQDFGAASTLSLLGNFTNSGSFYGYSSNANVTAANISVNNLFNNANAILSTIMPQGGIAGINSAVANLSLNISALNNIVNAGTISSAGNLNMTAGASIINQLPANVMAMLPTIQAMNAVNLSAANIMNTGMISSLFSNLNVATPQLVNSGTLQALSSSINIQSVLSNLLAVDNAGGVIQARDNVVFSTLGTTFDNEGAILSKANLFVAGGNIAADNIHFNSPSGLVKVEVDRIDGPAHVSAGDLILAVKGGTLTAGNMNLTGDPVYANSGGDVDLVAAGVFSGGSTFSTSGSVFTALASGNVTAVGAPNPGLVDASSSANNSAGGAIKIGAGVTYDGSYNITGATAGGGKIDLSTISFKTNGGDITLVANSGSTNNGDIKVGNLDTSGMGGLGVNQSGSGGIAGQSAGNITITTTTTTAGVSTGYLHAYGGGGGGGNSGTNGGAGGNGGLIDITAGTGAAVVINGDINSSGGGGGGSLQSAGAGGTSGRLRALGGTWAEFTANGPILNSSGGDGGTYGGGGSFGGGGGAGAGTSGGGGAGGYYGGGATSASGTKGGNGGGITGGGLGGDSGANGALGLGGGGAYFGEAGSGGTAEGVGLGNYDGGTYKISTNGIDAITVSKKVSDGFSGSGFTNSIFANVSVAGSNIEMLPQNTNDQLDIAGDIMTIGGTIVVPKDSSNLNLVIYGASAQDVDIILSAASNVTALSPSIEYKLASKSVTISIANNNSANLDASAATFDFTSSSELHLVGSLFKTLEVPQLTLVSGNVVTMTAGNIELVGITATGTGQSVTMTGGDDTIDITGSINMPDGDLLIQSGAGGGGGDAVDVTATDIIAKSVMIGKDYSGNINGVKSIALDNIVATDGDVSLLLDPTSTTASINIDSIMATNGNVNVTANPSSSSTSIGFGTITVDTGDVTIATDAGSNASSATAANISVIDGNISVTATSSSSTALVSVTRAYTTSGDITLTADGSNSSSNVTAKTIASDDGDVTLISETGNLYVLANGRITSVEGNVNLQIADSGTVGSDGIKIGTNSVVSAYSTAPSGSAGNVYIFIGSSPPPQNAGSAPTNVSGSTANGGAIYYGTSGFTGSSPTNYIHADTGEVVFDTDGVSSSKILLDGGVIINSNVPQITSLDLGDSTAVATIVALQGLGLVGGTLTVGGGGVATGGNAIVDPRDLSVAPLTALRVPGNVTLTMSNFTSDDSLNVDITASSTASQFSLASSGAVLQFTGTSPSVAKVNVTSTETGPIIYGYYSTSMTSDGSLDFKFNGDFHMLGSVTTSGDLSLAATGNNGYIYVNGGTTSGGEITMVTYGTGDMYLDTGVTTTNGNVTLTSPGGYIFTKPVSTGTGDINLLAADDITVDSSNSPLTLNADSSIHSTGGNIILNVSSLTNAGEIITDKSSGDITIHMFNAAGTLTNNGLIKTSQASGYIDVGTWDDQLTVAGDGTFDAGSGGTVAFTTAAGGPIVFSGTHEFLVGTTGGVGINALTVTLNDDTTLTTSGGIGTNSATLIAFGANTTIHSDLTTGDAIGLANNAGSELVIRMTDDSVATLSTDGANIRIAHNADALTFSKTSGSNTATLNTTGGHLYLTDGGVGTIALTVDADVVIASDSDIDVFVAKPGATGTLTNNGTITTSKNAGTISIGFYTGTYTMDGDGTYSVTGTGANSIALVDYASAITLSGGHVFDVGSDGSVSITSTYGDQTISGSITTDGDFSAYAAGELVSSGTISAKSVSIGSGSDLTVGSLESTDGSISVVATTGVLTISADAVLDATEGNITIQNLDTSSGSIFIGNGATLTATGDQMLNHGEIYVVIGSVPGSPTAGTTPSGFTLNTSNGGAGYFGSNGIDILSGSNVGNVDGSRLIFNTGSLSSSAISLDGDVTFNATASYNAEPDDEDILDKQTDTLRLVSFVRPSLNNNTGLAGGICTLSNDGAVIKHLGNAKVTGLKDQSIKLSRGQILLKTQKDTKVKIGGHLLEIASGAVVGITNIDGVLKIHNVIDNGHGDVVLNVGGKQRISLAPGQELIVSKGRYAGYKSMQEDKLSRRAVKTYTIEGEYVVTKADFSHLSYLKNYPLMRQLLVSKEAADKELVNNIVKMAASVMTVSSTKGTYKPVTD